MKEKLRAAELLVVSARAELGDMEVAHRTAIDERDACIRECTKERQSRIDAQAARDGIQATAIRESALHAKEKSALIDKHERSTRNLTDRYQAVENDCANRIAAAEHCLSDTKEKLAALEAMHSRDVRTHRDACTSTQDLNEQEHAQVVRPLAGQKRTAESDLTSTWMNGIKKIACSAVSRIPALQ